METRLCLVLVIINLVNCDEDKILEQLRLILLKGPRQINGQSADDVNNDDPPQYTRNSFRRYDNPIIGVPSLPSHLPPSEPILPGHTLLRPSFGMLKSALKFPHKELEDGAGVNGNMDNLGLRYGAKNQRLLYSSFRRIPADYVVVEVPNQPDVSKPQYYLSPAVFDLENQEPASAVLKHLKKTGRPLKKRNLKLYYYGNKNQADSQDYSKYLKPQSSFQEPTKRYRSYKEIFASLDDVIAKLLSLRQEMAFASNQNRRKEKGYHDNAYVGDEDLSSVDVSDLENGKEKEKTPLFQPDDNEEPELTPKQDWWKSKNMFDHVKVQSEAPEFHEFLPKDAFANDEKQWWYFGQDDFTSLTKTED